MPHTWKCVRCGFIATHPVTAGDHERKYYERFVRYVDGASDESLHIMEDLGE